jgi:dTDP-4-dehydrorhamnose 3,5-epimerase
MSEDLYFAEHNDFRGSHMKFYVDDNAQDLGFMGVREVFMTTNNKNTLRGLHRQNNPFSQQKIVKVVNGRFNLRVVIPNDVSGLNAFIKHNNPDKLTSNNGDYVFMWNNIDFHHEPIFVPEGALLGYVSLEDNSKMLYIADSEFNADCDDGFNPLSTRFDIDWGIEKDKLVMSERDANSREY